MGFLILALIVWAPVYLAPIFIGAMYRLVRHGQKPFPVLVALLSGFALMVWLVNFSDEIIRPAWNRFTGKESRIILPRENYRGRVEVTFDTFSSTRCKTVMKLPDSGQITCAPNPEFEAGRDALREVAIETPSGKRIQPLEFNSERLDEHRERLSWTLEN